MTLFIDGSDVNGIVRPPSPFPPPLEDFDLPLDGRDGAALLFALGRAPSAIC